MPKRGRRRQADCSAGRPRFVALNYANSIRVDNGPEFISRELDLWTYLRGVTLDLGRPRKPTDTAFIESFKGKFGAECLNAHWFMSLDEAR